MNQDEKRELETHLVAAGLSGLDDPDLLTMFAQIVEQFPGDKHWFLRGMINDCEPAKRREMYYSLKPKFAHFEPYPLETYLSQITEEATRMVSHRVMRVEGKRPDAIQVGDNFYVSAQNSADATHTLVKLVCSKCTRKRVFEGESMVDALIKARQRGWVHDVLSEKEICPKCPAVREGTRIGNA